MADIHAPAGTTPLDRLLRPRSIALIGATERSIWSVSAHDNLKRFGFTGNIHLVNPKGGIIHGQEAARSIAEIGERVDAALIMVPEAGLLEIIDELGAAGVAGAVVLSSGFAEAGAAGAARQAEMARRARQAGLRLIGPNCLGFASYLDNTAIWTTPLRRPMPGARLAIVSQSGALAGQMEQFAYQQRIGLTHLVSTGNEADLNVADIINHLAGQAAVRAIAVFLETVRDPAGFLAAVATARAAGKPVVVLKVGASAAAAKAAQAHTGSLVGNDAVFNAVCARHGIIRAYSMEELILTADLAAHLGPMPPGGLALAAMSGGLCEIALDNAETLGVMLPGLDTATMAALAPVLPEFAVPGNPLDLTGGAMLKPESITAALPVLAADPRVAALAFVFDVPLKEDARGAARKFIRHVAEGFKQTSKPCLLISHSFGTVSAEGRALVEEYGITYCAGGISLGLKALAPLLRAAPPPAPALPAAAATARPSGERAVLAYLAARGVPVVPQHLATCTTDATAAAQKLGGGLALKIASPDIAHKTEAGGVALNIAPEDAASAYEALLARVRAARPEAEIEGVIISPMRGGGTEIFVGTLNDPQWGPAISVGLGGIWVEALKDTSLRLLPVSATEAREMLEELRGKALLEGFRGAPPVDRAALAAAIAAIGNAALALGPRLVSLEINPLLATAEGVEALDALTVWED